MKEHISPETTIYPTPESLLQDSESFQSIEAVGQWREAQERGTQTMTDACSDARVSVRHALNGHNALVSITGIAASQPLIPYRFAATHPGVHNILTVGHLRCGGLAALAQLQNSNARPFGGAYDYVSSQIKSPDVVVQTTRTARHLAYLSNRPTLAMVMEHETEQLYPVAFFTERGYSYQASFSMDDLADQNLDRIYQGNFMPEFNEDWLPGDMQALMEKNRKQVKSNMDNPGFIESQKVQNPHSILVSTSIIPASNRYTEVFGKPNTCFAIRLPLVKEPDNGFTIDPVQLRHVINQADYPISHSMEGHGPFNRTRRLIIETPDISDSKRIADAFVSEPRVNEWIEKYNSHIIITQLQSAKKAIKSGKTVAAEHYI